MLLPGSLTKAGKLAVAGDAGVVLDVPGLIAGRFDLELSSPLAGAHAAITQRLTSMSFYRAHVLHSTLRNVSHRARASERGCPRLMHT